jgi:REP element-mobilizing transposase RayT
MAALPACYRGRMTRPLRIEYPGALYHVTARGNRRSSIYFDEGDRFIWLDVLSRICERFNFAIHAYCQMTDHYHLMVETVDGNLEQGMRQLNGQYAQQINRRHGLVGHLFQGRYKAFLVQKDVYLLELSRYIVLNPVRAGICAMPDQWDWSSYKSMCSDHSAPAWLDRDWVLGQFGADRASALPAYQAFVRAGIGAHSPLVDAHAGLLLGDQRFHRDHADRTGDKNLVAVAGTQRRLSALSIAQYAGLYLDRDEAMAQAYRSTAFSMAEIGAYFGVTYQTVSRAVKRIETIREQRR